MTTVLCFFFFFFNDTATTEIYTLSLHDALPISGRGACVGWPRYRQACCCSARMNARASANEMVAMSVARPSARSQRSEEHTSELQSRQYLVCRLLLEKKKIYVLQYINILSLS